MRYVCAAQYHALTRCCQVGENQHGVAPAGEGSQHRVQDTGRPHPPPLRRQIWTRTSSGHDAGTRRAH